MIAENNWLNHSDSFRKRAIQRLVSRSSYSVEMAEALIDALFSELTTPKLTGLLKAELGDPKVLDEFRPGPSGMPSTMPSSSW